MIKKTLCTALLLSTSVVADSHHNSHEARIAELESSISDLKQQVEKSKDQKATDSKALRVPGTGQTFELIFRPTLNTIYDATGSNKDYFDLASIPLTKVDAQARGNSSFSMSAAATRLGFKTNHDTSKGAIQTKVEIDFLARTTTRTQPRLRHAYVSYNQFLAGQTDSLFNDMTAVGSMADMSGIMQAPNRQAQIRAAQKFGAFDVAASFERPFVDNINNVNGTYTTETPTSTEGVTTRGSLSQPLLPDFVTSFKYNMSWGYVGLRAVVRDLRVKYLVGATTTSAGTATYGARKMGTGLGASINMNLCEKARLFAQYHTGKGIGRYLVETSGYSAYIDPINKIFDLIKVDQYLAGFEWKWTPEVRSTIMYNDYRLKLSGNMLPSANQSWNKKMKQGVVNTFFKPLPNTEIGVEYMLGYRKIAPRNDRKSGYGIAHRIQMVIMYTF